MSFTAGNYTRSIDTPTDPLDARMRSKLDGVDLDNSENPEDWSAEKVRAVAQMFERNDRAAQNKVQSGLSGDAFVATHPEFKDSKANGLLMVHQLKTLFGEGVAYTLDDYNTAYESLRASNFLNLDEKIVKEQNVEAAKQRAAAEKARNTPKSEQELWDMPMDELRRLDAVENHERMQRRGEEGGW